MPCPMIRVPFWRGSWPCRQGCSAAGRLGHRSSSACTVLDRPRSMLGLMPCFASSYARPYAMLVLEPCPSMGRVVGMASARVVPVVILSSAMCWAWRSVVVAATILDGMEGIGLGCARLRGMPDVPVAGEEPADGDLLARRAPELGLEPYFAMSYARAMSISSPSPMLGQELSSALNPCSAMS
ncbi:hypothetical protein Dimus_035532 [Dionaea muscipula]